MFTTFCGPVLGGVAAKLGVSLNVLIYAPCSTPSVYQRVSILSAEPQLTNVSHVARKEKHGFLDQGVALAEADIAAGKSKDQAYYDRIFTSYGDVIKLPGLRAPKYDYEYFPLFGAFDMAPANRQLAATLLPASRDPQVKGYVLSSVPEVELGAPEALAEETGRKVFDTG